MLAWGSELRSSRRMTIFAFCFGSESSASACERPVSSMFLGMESTKWGLQSSNLGWEYLLLVNRGRKHKACTMISAVEFPLGLEEVDTIYSRYLR